MLYKPPNAYERIQMSQMLEKYKEPYAEHDIQDVLEWHVRFYFYSQTGDTHNDSIIANWTKIWNPQIKKYPELVCSHEEIMLVNHDLAFTSTMRKDMGGKDGIVLRSAQGVIHKHPENWYYYDLAVSGYEYDVLFRWMCLEVIRNKGYDKLAILSFGTPWRFHVKDKWICSEVGHESVRQLLAIRGNAYMPIHNAYPWYKPNRVPSPIRESLYLFLKANLTPYSALTGKPLYKRKNE